MEPGLRLRKTLVLFQRPASLSAIPNPGSRLRSDLLTTHGLAKHPFTATPLGEHDRTLSSTRRSSNFLITEDEEFTCATSGAALILAASFHY